MEKTHILLDLFAKDTSCTHRKTHVGLLLDLSAKDTAAELVHIYIYIYMCMRRETHILLELTAKDKVHV